MPVLPHDSKIFQEVLGMRSGRDGDGLLGMTGRRSSARGAMLADLDPEISHLHGRNIRKMG
jgi:hypothetical protein